MPPPKPAAVLRHLLTSLLTIRKVMEQQTNKNGRQGGTSAKRKNKRRRNWQWWKTKKNKAPAAVCKTKESDLPTQEKAKGEILFIEDQTPREDDSKPHEKGLNETLNVASSESKTEERNSSQATIVYNTRYLERNVETYCLENFESNALIIFNHINFDNYADRISGKQDVLNIRDTFKEYNFHSDNIFEYTDYDRKDLKAVLKAFSECNFTHFGCVVVVVLTHGVENGYLIARDYSYHESELIDPFLYSGNQTLITKPKIFIIQTCGCSVKTAGMCSADNLSSDDEDETLPLIYTQPKEADVLIIYGINEVGSSCDEVKGSWLIKSLCSSIARLGDTEHLEDILTEVKDNIATENPGTENTELHIVSMSTLIRKLYFRKSHILQDLV